MITLSVVVVSLFSALPAMADTPNGTVGIANIAACKDMTTVTVTGSTTYANNRIDAGIYYYNGSNWVLLAQASSPAFGSGSFRLAVTLPYTSANASEGEVLRLDVQLQRSSGGSYVNVGDYISQYVSVADKYCFGKCSVVVDTSDKAPASGTLTVRSHYGAWFRPEGWLHGAMPVIAGQRAQAVFVGLPCNQVVRAWYYPKTGDKTPKMLPAQYWPNEFQANGLGGTNPYTTAFAKGLKATSPLEADDVFVVR
jgi:hypothetical protein